jgi:hypothetical protein
VIPPLPLVVRKVPEQTHLSLGLPGFKSCDCEVFLGAHRARPPPVKEDLNQQLEGLEHLRRRLHERLAARDLKHRAALEEMMKHFATEVGKVFCLEAALRGQLAAAQDDLRMKDVMIMELYLEGLTARMDATSVRHLSDLDLRACQVEA